MKFTRRVKLVAPFWLLSACYFLIPFIRDPIQPPALLINIDNAIPFIWWMIIPYYFYYIALLLPLMITEQSKLQAYTSIAMQLLLISYTIFIIWPITCKAAYCNVYGWQCILLEPGFDNIIEGHKRIRFYTIQHSFTGNRPDNKNCIRNQQ